MRLRGDQSVHGELAPPRRPDDGAGQAGGTRGNTPHEGAALAVRALGQRAGVVAAGRELPRERGPLPRRAPFAAALPRRAPRDHALSCGALRRRAPASADESLFNRVMASISKERRGASSEREYAREMLAYPRVGAESEGDPYIHKPAVADKIQKVFVLSYMKARNVIFIGRHGYTALRRRRLSQFSYSE